MSQNIQLLVDPLTSLWYRCSKCKQSYFVDMSDGDRHLLNNQMRCPNFGTSCRSQMKLQKKWPENGRVADKCRKISALELYRASAGIGLPEERQCSPAEVAKLMIGARIRAVQLDKAPDPQNSLLLTMTLDTGKVLYFTTSTKGALIYKVTEA